MAIARKIAYNVISNATAKVLSTLLALVGIGFITRYLGQEGFGEYATTLAFFSFFGALADLGLYSVATREISREGSNEDEIIGNIFSLRIFTSLLVLIISPLIIYFFPYSLEVKKAILITAAAFVFSSGYMVLNGIFQKNLTMYKVAMIELVGKILQTAIIILAVVKNWGFLTIIFSLFVYMVFNFCFVFLLSRKYVRFHLHFNLPYWKKFLKMSAPMGISVIITFLYFKMDTILLSILKGSTEVGIYNAAYKILENITFFPAMIVGLTLPLTSQFIFTDKQRFNEISNKTAKVFFLLIVPLVIAVMFLAKDIMLLVGGTEFAVSANILRILVVALIFIFFGNFFNNILLAGNLQKKMMYALGFCAAFNIGTNLIFIPLYSYTGAAITSAATEFLVVAITSFLAFKYLDYVPKIENWTKFLFSGLAMTIFLFIFQGQNFFFLALASSAIYFVFLWLTKAITTEEIRSIAQKRDTI